MPFPGLLFLTPWGGEVNLFKFETIPRYIRMCLESWIYKQNITDIAKQRNMCVDLCLAIDDVGICRQLIGYNSSRCLANGSLPLLGLLAARQLSTRFEE